jgi:hypothetical protein
MLPVSELTTDTCYDCGCETIAGHQYLACLWKSPAGGPEHWGLVDVCPVCAQQRERRRRERLFVVCVLVALLTAVIAYPLLL